MSGNALLIVHTINGSQYVIETSANSSQIDLGLRNLQPQEFVTFLSWNLEQSVTIRRDQISVIEWVKA